MRPSQEDLLATLRISLSGTVLPAIEDRWARYVANAMDLVLQHLELRLANETDVLADDSADMAQTLAKVTSIAAAAGNDATEETAKRRTTLADLVPSAGDTALTQASTTEPNERLRAAIVDVLRWTDDNDGHVDADLIAELRDEVHRMIRRQTDRMTGLVRPLFMSFGPVGS